MTDTEPGRRLAGRRILVTGAGSGIGRASALRLAQDGARVAALDLRLPSVEDVAAEIAATGGSAIAIAVDVRDEASVAAAVDAVVGEFGGLDSIVTAAGILHSGSTHEMTLDTWESMIGINLTGTFLPVRYGLPHLLEAGGGTIVTIGSIASIVASGSASCYDASKGGVLQFTRAIGAEYADRNIRANCVCPGAVKTNLRANSVEVLGPPGLASIGRVQVPGSRWADPSELANVVAFMCSDESSFMNASAVMVDGGLTAV